MFTLKQKFKNWLPDQRNERSLKLTRLARSWALAALASAYLGPMGPSAEAAVQTVYGSYLANDSTGQSIGLHGGPFYPMSPGQFVAVHFKIYQTAPVVGTPVLSYHLAELKISLSYSPMSPAWSADDKVELALYTGSELNGPAVLKQSIQDITHSYYPHDFPFFVELSYQPASGVVLDPNEDYWVVIHYTSTSATPPQLNWHKNAAGVNGTVAVFNGSWTVQQNVLQPVVKVRGVPINEPCPESSFLYGGIYGAPYSDTDFELHTELLCPPATLQYYSCAAVSVPANTSSYDAAGIMVQAINTAPQCGGGLPFHAERSGNVVRISQSDCPCTGAYVCGDPNGIIGFARSMGYQHDGMAMKANLYFGGLATGVAADPLIPAGVQISHWLHSNSNGVQQVYNTLFSPGAGTSAADVAKGIETQLRLQGDFPVTADGDKLRLETVLIGTDAVDQSDLVESGTLSIQSQGPIGQAFAASGPFNYVDLRTYDAGGSAGATLQVKIFQNTIGGTLLATSDPVPLPNGWASPVPVRFYFPSSVSIPLGSTPVLQVIVIAGDPWLVASGPDSYPSGTAIVQGQADALTDLWFSVGTLRRSPGGYYDVAYRINDTGLLWAFAPFDEPNPFVLFGPPVVTIERVPPTSVRLRWTTNAPGYVLQFKTNLNTTNWADAMPSPAILGTNYVVTNTIVGTQRFYRLRKP